MEVNEAIYVIGLGKNLFSLSPIDYKGFEVVLISS